MRKRIIKLICIFLSLTMLLGLSGCGIAGKLFKAVAGREHSGTETDGPEEPADTVLPEPSGDIDTASENEPSPEPEEGKSENTVSEEPESVSPSDDSEKLPDVYIRGRSDLEWNDDRTLIVNFDYQLLSLGEESERKYPELAKKLLIVNDLIATEEGNLFMSDVKSAQEMKDEEITEAIEDDRMPYRAYWNILMRRADSGITSFVVRSDLVSGFDYDRISYRGYNFRTETGEELALSDIVTDEAAFLALVSERVKAQIMEDAPDLYDGKSDMPDLKEYLDTGARGNWTIDPQGVTVWLDAYTFTPFDMVVTVLFDEDTDGTLFADEFRDHRLKDWVMNFPLYTHITFDAEDDGVADQVMVYENTEYYSEDDTYGFVNGLNIIYNGKKNSFLNWDDMYGTSLSLVHRNGKTFILDEFSEYDYGFMNTYELSNGRVSDCGYVNGRIATLPYEEWDEEDTTAPDHLLADPEDFTVNSVTNALSTCGSERRYRLSDKGEFIPTEEWYTFVEGSRYELTLLVDLPESAVVDEETHTVTDEKIDLRKGDKITMEYTDETSWVDFRTKDGKLVRIKIGFDHDDGYKYVVLGKDGIADIYDAFDGLFWAG